MKVSASKDLDRIDKNILKALQIDARISNVTLSKQVGLSPSPCLERVKRLEEQGYILGYEANLNPEKLGAAMLVFVEITLDRTSSDVFSEFSAAVQKHSAIQECHLVSGNFDFLLKTRVADMSSYRKLLGDTLLKLPSVSASRTYVVMEEVKSTQHIRVL
ncbi:leucine-responsive transcriptional regulator Lrp [Alteromonas sp. 5E99-2]|uniref:leucine-responsive transcriptional regulator Lrp n=1 Tax=Alteromonas sp. 5E99-2 TaxID=2817683 RepID=UPI001A98F472|nr:leucine-responsive transcriptional regulator Lrp [Alteromonas sp. 5E99-2]MBO1255084.1 leucine-responsive transcriptional regulator Lrp [Alteromonas sp. 5E99-2]